MRIIYYTSGITGSGRIVRGIAIGNALRRKGLDAEYAILSSSDFAFLCDELKFAHREIPLEDEEALSDRNYKSSHLFNELSRLRPDVLIVDLLWFPLYHFIGDLACKKIFLCRQVNDRFFQMELNGGLLDFNPDAFDFVLRIEPFDSKVRMKAISPIIVRNRDELLSREQACARIGLSHNEQNCLIAYNGEPGEYHQVVKEYSYLQEQGYVLKFSSNYENGLFPIADYYNAFDLVVCGAGYNFFWEMIYFNKEAIFVPAVRTFETGQRRMREYRDFDFSQNGADQLVDEYLLS
ncbi:MAG TPA: hypothetical protein PKM65_16425 [Spirochaetota bacterium]|nr:hypothetical protein [Spirochaetota bacterium]HNT11758.1 hypothetical protein [Spirochaetota bacterium]HNV48737.1 hypothetical protein [Spirochaetota bacterium]HOS40016.1 hypothetical protein [Spirochaetota bacterium]HPU88713.1 hypothetical protein [Spirochaetota bacterium]